LVWDLGGIGHPVLSVFVLAACGVNERILGRRCWFFVSLLTTDEIWWDLAF
jgi:hypothetical protein